jgi:hypothetical protein
MTGKTALSPLFCRFPASLAPILPAKIVTNPERAGDSPASAVGLAFASVSPQVRKANAKPETALETKICKCPFGSDIRK